MDLRYIVIFRKCTIYEMAKIQIWISENIQFTKWPNTAQVLIAMDSWNSPIYEMNKSYIVDIFTWKGCEVLHEKSNNQRYWNIYHKPVIKSITWKEGSIFSASYVMNFQANKKLNRWLQVPHEKGKCLQVIL